MNSGDVIQITNEDHHWFPCLLIIDEVKSWGVQAFVIIPNNERNTPNATAYIRLSYADFEVIGPATLAPGDTPPAPLAETKGGD
mgnify:CR=1 FL=1